MNMVMRRKCQRRPRLNPSKWAWPVYRGQAISQHWHKSGQLVVGFGMFYMKGSLNYNLNFTSEIISLDLKSTFTQP
jgi:hypothetical protein